ncbi:hypothetical protein E2C01_061810 [Portunus trituberculatus]|uniref:Uncharacterized protein n=1 Tax=Portunus trituberculatus TaxID=210409 RepID=A0A5B7H958_PORTR|nr:hypothetical protein [Portunus trituberculatus]
MTATISFKALSSLCIMMILLMLALSSLKPENSLSYSSHPTVSILGVFL